MFGLLRGLDETRHFAPEPDHICCYCYHRCDEHFPGPLTCIHPEHQNQGGALHPCPGFIPVQGSIGYLDGNGNFQCLTGARYRKEEQELQTNPDTLVKVDIIEPHEKLELNFRGRPERNRAGRYRLPRWPRR